MKLKKLCAKLGKLRYPLKPKKKTASLVMTDANEAKDEESANDDRDESTVNGSILCDKPIPFEILLEIFLKTDHKSLLSCQRVCKYWRDLIQSYTWRKKAELTLNRRLPPIEDGRWQSYYFVCDRQPFGRNLIRNHSGAEDLDHWEIIKSQGHRWAVECPPVGAPNLPTDDEAVLAGNQHCFVTSYSECSKFQTIDLLEEGFSIAVLDKMQPIVQVSEWYCSRFDCPAFYVCKVRLLGEENKELKSYLFQKSMIEDGVRDKWHKFTHTLTDYGEGLRRIQFIHLGQDIKVWAGHYGSKMAGACVTLLIPDP